MKILIDTHIFLWVLSDDPRLSDAARSYLQNEINEIWISTVSFWEISIKHKLKPASMPISGKQAIHYAQISGLRTLPIELSHIEMLDDIDQHHSDPFDRMIISQALSEPMRILTHDTTFKKYTDSLVILA